jgi:hypothetical protein
MFIYLEETIKLNKGIQKECTGMTSMLIKITVVCFISILQIMTTCACRNRGYHTIFHAFMYYNYAKKIAYKRTYLILDKLNIIYRVVYIAKTVTETCYSLTSFFF